MASSSDSRVALVTGAGRGIGRAIALALAKDGATIAINDRELSAEVKETVREVQQYSPKSRAYAASVDDRAALDVMVASVHRELGGVGILVHNAGTPSRGHTVFDSDPVEVEKLLQVHAIGPFYLTKLILPKMRSLGRGDVVYISSAATRLFSANGGPYSMAKAAGEAFAFTLASEERRYGIRSNIVAPGLVDTEMGRRFLEARGMSVAEVAPKSPFGRICTAEDIAGVVAFLVSENNGYANGQRMFVDGGS